MPESGLFWPDRALDSGFETSEAFEPSRIELNTKNYRPVSLNTSIKNGIGNMKLLHVFDDTNYSLLFLLRLCPIILFSVFSTIGCSTQFLKGSGVLERHAIIISKSGKPYLPIEQPICRPPDACDDSRHWTTKEGETYIPNEFDGYLDNLIQSASDHFEKGKKLLLFFHGGLNDQDISNELASRLPEQIKDEYYPIFINWNSALLSSYAEHLTSVRQGKTARWAWVTSPTYLVSDLGRGILRAPFVWWSLIGNDLTSWPTKKNNWFFNFFDLAEDERNANKIAATLRLESPDKSFQYWLGPQAPPTFLKDQIWGNATTILTYPIKFLVSPWIDALGKSAWENMFRRTDLLFHRENDFKALAQPVGVTSNNREAPITACPHFADQQPGLVHNRPRGALSIFFRKLAEKIHAGGPKKWSITLVGHSMGAIIVNHILRDFGSCLPIDNIVFMAAASTINNYNDSVFPFMVWRLKESEADPKKPVPKVYHLMLHELAETSETNYMNLPPTGSLLVWIDNFLSTPNTPMDRTSGRFTNLMLSLHTTPREIRPYISIKRFPGGGSSWGGTRAGIPANHSDFAGRFKFWDKTCWEVPEGMDESEKFQNEKKKNCFYEIYESRESK